MIRLLIPFSCLMLAACASAPSGGRETVRFISNPDGATMTASTGFTCTTPCATQLRRDDTFTAVFTKTGYTTVEVNVATHSMDERKNYSLGPLTLGYETSSVVADPSGIYNTEHVPNPVTVELPPLGKVSTR